MELKELVGKHMLDAVDITYENSQICRFRLDGVVYVAAEDPDDGYRSHMRDLVVDEGVDMKNVFPAIEVLARHCTKTPGALYPYVNDVLELVDTTTGKVVLTVGTDRTDDYYPFFVADFVPSAMVTNV